MRVAQDYGADQVSRLLEDVYGSVVH